MKKLLLETLCPHCHQDLTRDGWIDLKLQMDDGRKGTISLSAYFGDYSIKQPFFIDEGALATFLCPHCATELTVPRTCGLCQAPEISLALKTGGFIDVCTRKGCKGHALGGFGDTDELIMLVNRLMDTPYL